MAKPETESPATQKQRRYSPEVRRQMILDAAASLFREKPDATVDEIADRAGVTRQLVGQYFPGGGVEKIHTELIEQATASFAEQVLQNEYPPPKDLKEWRAVIAKTTRRQFEWAVGLEMPWMFAGEASGLTANLGYRRSRVRVDMLALVMPWSAAVLEDTPTNRLLVQCEYRAIDELIWLATLGEISVDEGVRIAVARWRGIVEKSASLLA